ncbi:DNA repair endonuclease XPF [Trichoplax sp. H2]|nr:DNA repair endonuclease XPF [Trichoplax sp. H2]|eukprot:RDD47919.1 DNA repair endonuclease XPF [Trichoplax sp. H2]
MAGNTGELLEFDRQIFLDLLNEDGLVIMAKGLGVDRMMLNFLKLYCSPKSFVLVLNTSNYQEEYFIEELKAHNVDLIPKIITSQYSSIEREEIYLQGGVLFVTPRILVVDMLSKRVPIHLINGIIVAKAHKMIESYQEAFITRLYRQNNKNGFVKAFSDAPSTFTSGFSQVEKVMKNLFVRKLFLWPRFHATVTGCLEKHKVDVVELLIPMTKHMVTIQTAIIDIIYTCLKELKKGNPSLDTSDLVVENAMSQAFDNIVKVQLEPIWHQLSGKTKQLIDDLKMLRLLILFLTQYDCITFLNYLESVRTNGTRLNKYSLWLFLDSTNVLFTHARKRVFGDSTVATENSKTRAEFIESDQLDTLLEPNPKWSLLTKILEEIKDMDCNSEEKRVLICALDERTCYQIKNYLIHGEREALMRNFNRTRSEKNKISLADGTGNENRNAEISISPIMVKLSKKSKEKRKSNEAENQEETSKKKSKTDAIHLNPEEIEGLPLDAITIHPLHGCSDPYSLTRVLTALNPRFVILYDPELVFVRQLEVFKASRPGQQLRVYFTMYSSSAEEQKYLTALRKEKEAFETLIREKAAMVIPEEREGKSDSCQQFSCDIQSIAMNVDTRIAGGRSQVNRNRKIIVDVREFRSELPSLIHKRGIDIVPITLKIGDYILSPDMCVERKSLSDLIGSLNSGRLYNQVVAMTRYYQRPILLIEFVKNKPFVLESKRFHPGEISFQDLTSKVALLTLQFPKLRLLWCDSPHSTAELFEQLKLNHDEPDPNYASEVGDEENAVVQYDMYTPKTQDFVLKLPGISIKNYRSIMNNIKDFQELRTANKERLIELLGNTNVGKNLWEFIHSVNQKVSATSTVSRKK